MLPYNNWMVTVKLFFCDLLGCHFNCSSGKNSGQNVNKIVFNSICVVKSVVNSSTLRQFVASWGDLLQFLHSRASNRCPHCKAPTSEPQQMHAFYTKSRHLPLIITKTVTTYLHLHITPFDINKLKFINLLLGPLQRRKTAFAPFQSPKRATPLFGTIIRNIMSANLRYSLYDIFVVFSLKQKISNNMAETRKIRHECGCTLKQLQQQQQHN